MCLHFKHRHAKQPLYTLQLDLGKATRAFQQPLQQQPLQQQPLQQEPLKQQPLQQQQLQQQRQPQQSGQQQQSQQFCQHQPPQQPRQQQPPQQPRQQLQWHQLNVQPPVAQQAKNGPNIEIWQELQKLRQLYYEDNNGEMRNRIEHLDINECYVLSKERIVVAADRKERECGNLDAEKALVGVPQGGDFGVAVVGAAEIQARS
ncbi:PREDICTED: integrator complex subunit 4 homolog [Trachymyrmex cornetzi]|uniref:integrator complex subunit 4 homolog n=1 Tax=Trachymyrmex cornetzi TaxID=471704 RepID=UPI00084F811A|nr:PREDICTED: integrator complex subunit 4 homolog [Trachymyrmex cornetzi]